MAIPLVVVAVVCLLVTSWAWIFDGGDGRASSTAPVSAESAVPAGPPGAESTVSAASGPSAPPAAALPTRSDTPADPSASGSPAPPTDTAPPSSTAPAPGPGSPAQPAGSAPAPGGAGTPAVPQAGTPSAATPPAASSPASTSAGTQPRDILVIVDRYATSGYIDIVNPTDRPLASWKLTVTVTGSAFLVWRTHGNDGFVANHTSTTATATSDRPLLAHEELTVYFELKDPVKSSACNLSGVPCQF
ncbi:hypothetical protein [Streptodolium elevatio]|uniref:CBM2 domain-containing protein n=1 Tax=Streptodolium elevatio TaxID=3157996 RepID=A0ABV3DDS4_9ACTN